MKETATICGICKKSFKESDIKVTDHSHYSGQIYWIAHQTCNIERRSSLVKIYFHNASRYDSHLLLTSLAKLKARPRCGIKMKNSQTPRSLRFGLFEICDSFDFLAYSLSDLVKLLPPDHNFRILKAGFSKIRKLTEKQLSFLRGKMLFPYAYYSQWEVLHDSRIPPKESFFNSLTGVGISDEEYQEFIRMWLGLNIKDAADLLSIYVCSDTLFLAECFQNFRLTCFSHFGLDICAFASLPSWSFESFLFNTGSEIGMLHTEEMISFIRRATKGGFCFVNDHFFRGADPHDDESEGVEKEYGLYVDANNLYGSAMEFALPVGGFRFISKDECRKLERDLKSGKFCDQFSEKSFFVEVDVHCPKNLHDIYSDFPFLPHKAKIGPEQVSLTTLQNLEMNGRKKIFSEEKLISSLEDREHYVCHLLLLQQALEHGLILKKVHTALEFEQTPFLHEYISRLSVQRGQAKSSVEKTVCKLSANSLYGRLLIQPFNFIESSLVQTDKLLEKKCANSFLKSVTILSEDFVLTHSAINPVKMNVGWAAGAAILDISKFIMYRFFYDVLRPVLGPSCSIKLSDTDSFIIGFRCTSYSQTMDSLSPFIDFSNYPADHHRYNPKTANQLFLLKDELRGAGLKELIALRSKCYSYSSYENDKKIVCKGVSRREFFRSLQHSDFRKCLQTGIDHSTSFQRISAKDHIIKTVSNRKIALSVIDLKRFQLDCGKCTLPYGHYLISENCGSCHKCNH